MKNKKAWIRIVEVTIAILIIGSILLIVIEDAYTGKRDVVKEVNEKEISILRSIEIDSAFRNSILSVDSVTYPIVQWEDFGSRGLGAIKTKITDKTPDYLTCEAVLCKMDNVQTCVLNSLPANKEIYAQTTAVTASLTNYNPRQLKLFCWEKG